MLNKLIEWWYERKHGGLYFSAACSLAHPHFPSSWTSVDDTRTRLSNIDRLIESTTDPRMRGALRLWRRHAVSEALRYSKERVMEAKKDEIISRSGLARRRI